MSEKHIEELIIRFIEGSCPDEEMRELLDWVRESTEHRDTLFGMKDIYDRSRLRERMTDEQIEAGWMRLVAECGIPEEEGRAAARTDEYYPQPDDFPPPFGPVAPYRMVRRFDGRLPRDLRDGISSLA